MAVVSVSIVGRCRSTQSFGRPYTEFHIQVRCREKSTVVKRRYTEFEALDNQLRPHMPSLPKLPPKGIVKRQSFMDQREFDLGRLLSAMVSLDPELSNPALRSFLSVPSVLPDSSPARIAVMDSPGSPATTLSDQPRQHDSPGRPKWLPDPDTVLMDNQTRVERPAWLDSIATPCRKSCSDADDVPQPILAQDPVDAYPNFAGMWNLDQIEGDMDALMTELDLPWMMRKAAAAAKYGVKKAKANVSQSDNHIEVENITPLKSLKRTFHADGIEHEEVLDGRRLKTSSRWEGRVLVSESRNAKTGKALPKVARYLQDDRMIAEQFLSTGASVRQIFVKGPEGQHPLQLNSSADSLRTSVAQDSGRESNDQDEMQSSQDDMQVLRPDFGGNWVLRRNEGDMELLLKELGLPWVARKAAAAAKYGVGAAKAKIVQSQDEIDLETVTPLKTFSRKFVANGAERDDIVDGKSFKTVSCWEGNVLVVNAQRIQPAKTFPTTRRYLNGEEMIVEQTLGGGQHVRQVFVRE